MVHTQGCANRVPLTWSVSFPTAPDLPEQAFPSAVRVSVANTYIWFFSGPEQVVFVSQSGLCAEQRELRCCSDVHTAHTHTGAPHRDWGHAGTSTPVWRSAWLYGYLTPPTDIKLPSESQGK